MNRPDFTRRIRQIQIISRQIVEGFLSGNYRSVFRGPGLDFDEVREYNDGDDARTIDWNVTSRMSTPYTKTFKEEREMVLFLLMDVSASCRPGMGIGRLSDHANMLAALLAYSAASNNDRVGALFFSDRIEKWIPPQKGKKHTTRLLHDLYEIVPEGQGSDLGLACRTASELLKRRGVIVLLSDFKLVMPWKELSLLRRRHDVIAMRVVDPSDFQFPRIGLLALRDPETGEIVHSNGRSPRFRKVYWQHWDTNIREWERGCRKRGIDTLLLRADEDPVEKLVVFFKQRSRRR